MGYESPNVTLIDGTGNILPVQNGASIPASTPGLLSAGADGTTSRFITLDSAGRQLVVGAGIAGTPAGGVITIQGVVGGTAIPVNASSPDLTGTGNLTAAGQAVTVVSTGGFSSWSVLIAGTFSVGSNVIFETSLDGVNWQAANGRVSGAATTTVVTNVSGPGPYVLRGNVSAIAQFRARCTTFQSGDNISVIIRLSYGTGAIFMNAPLPPGTNTIGAINQGISNTLINAWANKITDGYNGPVAVKAASIAPLATDPSLVVALSPNTANSNIGLVGFQQDVVSSGSITATSQTAVVVVSPGWSSSSWQLSGTWTGTVNFEKSLDNTNWYAASFYDAAQNNGIVSTTVNGIYFSSVGACEYIRIRTSGTWTGTLNWSNARGFGDKSTTIQDSLPSGTNNIGFVSIRSASNAASTSVGSATTSTTLVAANSNRIGATIYNESNAYLYVKLGTSVSLTSYTVMLVPYAYYEAPFRYNGIITGIWSAVDGNARITEVT